MLIIIEYFLVGVIGLICDLKPFLPTLHCIGLTLNKPNLLKAEYTENPMVLKRIVVEFNMIWYF